MPRHGSVRGPARLVAFDLDGTLLPGTSVSLFLAERLGHVARMRELEEEFRQGLISNAVVARESALAFAGMPVVEVEALLAEVPVIGGVAETLAALSARGVPAILATVTWRFAARYFQRRFGFAAASGTEMDAVDGRLSGVVSRHFDGEDKRAFAAAECAGRGLAMADCAAVGDSRSDLPLFAAVGFAVAFNGTAEAVAAAHAAIESDDLRAVLPLLGCGVTYTRESSTP